MTSDSAATPGARSAARWHLCLLGGVRLQDTSTVHSRFATRAIAALLARLALAPGRDHPREELTELLWPGVDATTGRRRLRQALSLLKAVLEPPQDHPWPVLQADRRQVRLIPGAISCDVHAFEAHGRAGQRAMALAAYQGEFMPGFFDEWIHDERLRLSALHDRLTATQARGESHAPVPPMPGPSPSPARRVSDRVPVVARTGAPAYLTRYFPDRPQFERLQAQLLDHRLVCLLGPGGSGKTRLAVKVVEQWGARGGSAGDAEPGPPSPFSVVLFVPLAAAQTLEQLLGALQSALQISATPSALDNLVARLEGVRALLVLDNLEQLADVAGRVLDPLVTALPLLHVLVTSRRRVGLEGEREFQIEPLPVPPAGASLPAAGDSPSVGLFIDRARAVRGDFHLSARNHAAVVDLVRAMEGMPLAIELAASRIRAFTPAQMLARLRGPVAAPGDTPRPGPAVAARPAAEPAVAACIHAAHHRLELGSTERGPARAGSGDGRVPWRLRRFDAGRRAWGETRSRPGWSSCMPTR
jgi:predicted ATPase